jgi:hypothetical protein
MAIWTRRGRGCCRRSLPSSSTSTASISPTSIDSSGLFALVQADTRARQAGTRLTLVPPGALVARIFAWTGLESRLHFVAAA